jgi:hypothetical protein
MPSDGFECYWLVGNFGPHNAEKEIGTISGPQSGVPEANATFIVKAVNSHDALVKALRWIAENPGDSAGIVTTAQLALASIKETA